MIFFKNFFVWIFTFSILCTSQLINSSLPAQNSSNQINYVIKGFKDIESKISIDEVLVFRENLKRLELEISYYNILYQEGIKYLTEKNFQNQQYIKSMIEIFNSYQSKIDEYKQSVDKVIKKLKAAVLDKFNLPEKHDLKGQDSKDISFSFKVVQDEFRKLITSTEEIQKAFQKIQEYSIIFISLEKCLKKCSLGQIDDNSNFLRFFGNDAISQLIKSQNSKSDLGKEYIKKAHQLYHKMQEDNVVNVAYGYKSFIDGNRKYEINNWKLLHIFLGSLPLKSNETMIGGVHFNNFNDDGKLYNPIVMNNGKDAFLFYQKDSVYFNDGKKDSKQPDYLIKRTTLFPSTMLMLDCIKCAIAVLSDDNKTVVEVLGKNNFYKIQGKCKDKSIEAELTYDSNTKTIESFYPIYEGINVEFGNISADNYKKFIECYDNLSSLDKSNYNKVKECLDGNGAIFKDIPQQKTSAGQQQTQQQTPARQQSQTPAPTPGGKFSPLFKEQGSQPREASQSYRSEDARLENNLSNHSLEESGLFIGNFNNQSTAMSPSPNPVGKQLGYSESKEELFKEKLGLLGNSDKNEIIKAYNKEIERLGKSNDDQDLDLLHELEGLYKQVFPQS